MTHETHPMKEKDEPSLSTGELQAAIRRAHNNFDKWNEVTGCFTPFTSQYHEIQGLLEDAVHFGAQQATGIYKRLESEK